MKESFHAEPTPEAKPFKKENHTLRDLAWASSIVAPIAALATWWIAESAKPLPTEEHAHAPAPEKVNEKLKAELEIVTKKLNYGEQEVEHHLKGKEYPGIHVTEEWTEENLPVPSLPYHLYEDISDIESIEDAIKTRNLNFATEGKSTEEIGKMYEDTASDLREIVARRRKIEELNFNQYNDPRMVALYHTVAKLMNAKPREDFYVQLRSVGAEAAQNATFEARTDFDANSQGAIYLDSSAILGILSMKGIDHLRGCSTLANELCHRIRGERHKSYTEYKKAFEHDWPEDAIGPSMVPRPIADFYDEWFTKIYKGPDDSPRARFEKESFYVAYLTSEDLLKNGITLRLNTRVAAAVGLSQTFTK